MNKQEFSEAMTKAVAAEAVRSYKGKWPSDKDFMEFCVDASLFFITKEQFRTRARELGYGADGTESDWYDYTNQKALRLPPAGVECEANIAETVFYRVVPMYFGNSNAAVLRSQSTGNDFYIDQKEVKFRPLDWNRKAEADRKRVVDAVVGVNFNGYVMTKSTAEALYNAGFIRMPEDK